MCARAYSCVCVYVSQQNCGVSVSDLLPKSRTCPLAAWSRCTRDFRRGRVTASTGWRSNACERACARAAHVYAAHAEVCASARLAGSRTHRWENVFGLYLSLSLCVSHSPALSLSQKVPARMHGKLYGIAMLCGHRTSADFSPNERSSAYRRA